MTSIQVIEEVNIKGNVKAVYDQFRSVFGKGPGAIKSLGPWLNLLGL